MRICRLEFYQGKCILLLDVHNSLYLLPSFCTYIYLYRSLQSELQAARGCVAQLESYLGGELPEEGSGVTWRDERSTLLARINVRCVVPWL